MFRLGHSQALLGPDLYKKVKETPVLVVGAGGIGCELLKNLVLVGFANIEIIDLDTIDLSNLNRQFLFRKPDISKSKALVAAASARHFNPSSNIKIHARHGNVKDSQNDVEWIKGFGLVMNALDNMDARRHVNRLCQAAGVPLMESGTAGYLGQVTAIQRDETECFDCTVKPTPKSYPVCTIRATPSEPIHCIVWAKSYLFGKLFGEDDEAVDSAELDKAQASGENAEEIRNLKKEAQAFREVRQNLGDENGPKDVFKKVFEDDINRLLSMEDMWNKEGRVKPVPLSYDSIMDGTFVTPPLRKAPAASAKQASGHVNGNAAPSEKVDQANAAASSSTNAQTISNGSSNGPSARKLKDQKELSVKENLELFVNSCRRLSARAIAHPNVLLEFDKDDDDTLNFVLATANLRAIAYGIANKTRFEVKQMAGNIIPAIATTNAIIAGLVVMQALNLLSKNVAKARNVYIRPNPALPLGYSAPVKPDPKCAVCRDLYISFKANPEKVTLGTFVNDIVKKWLVSKLDNGSELELSVIEGTRILYDPWEDEEDDGPADNSEKTLAELGVGRGSILSVRDMNDEFRPVQFCLSGLDEGATESYILPEAPTSLPTLPPKPQEREDSEDIIEAIDALPVSSAPVAGKTRKRAAPEEEGEEGSKRLKTAKASNGSNVIEIE